MFNTAVFGYPLIGIAVYAHTAGPCRSDGGSGIVTVMVSPGASATRICFHSLSLLTSVMPGGQRSLVTLHGSALKP